MENKELYIVSGSHLDLATGAITPIIPKVCPSKEVAKDVLRDTYDYYREGYYGVPDEVADEDGDSISGGYCNGDEACIYACAEFACDMLVEVASFIVSKVETMTRKKGKTMQKKTLYIDAVRLRQYETMVCSMNIINGIDMKSYRETVESWRVDFDDGIHTAEVQLHFGNWELHHPFWASICLLANGCEQSRIQTLEHKICGTYELRDGGDIFPIEVVPSIAGVEDMELVELADKKLLVQMSLDKNEDIDIDSGEVNYYVPVYFDPDTVFVGLPGCVSTDETDDWVNVYVRWNPHTNAVVMVVTYDWANGSSATLLVALDTDEQQQLHDWLFRTSKEVYGKTPEEEYMEYMEYDESDDSDE